MGEVQGRPFDFKFLGVFSLTAPDGTRIHIRSRKGIALLGLLATAERGERTRAWLQERLWGSRELRQAQTSLRRELTGLRLLLNGFGYELLRSDTQAVWLDLDLATIDIRQPDLNLARGEFLEGLEFARENKFDQWLREKRESMAARVNKAAEVKGDGNREPAPPATPQPALALAIMPIRLNRDPEQGLSALGGDLVHAMAKFVSTRKWLPVLLPPEMVERERSEAPLRSPEPAGHARYVLAAQLSRRRDGARLVLDLEAMPGRRLLWTETLDIDPDAAESNWRDGVGRLASEIATRVSAAEVARIRLLPPDDLGAAEFTHLVRGLLGQVSMDAVALARDYLDRAVALGRRTAEHVILDAYLQTFAFMGSEYSQVDPSLLRSYASVAINADPTDWRGTLLGCQIELWLNNTQLAIVHARSAKELSPYNSSTLAALGMAYCWDGQPELATVELDAALALSWMERRPYMLLCNLALAYLMLDRLGQALTFCDQAVSCIPELGIAYVLKVEILTRLGRHHDAADVYLDSIRGRLDDVIALATRQRVLPPAWLDQVEKSLLKAMETAAAPHGSVRRLRG